MDNEQKTEVAEATVATGQEQAVGALSPTAKATEARKAKALVRRKEQQILKRYGEFLPDNTVDPIGVYRLWQKSIFGDLKKGIEADDTIMYFVVSQARAAGIDPRVPRQIYAIPYQNRKTGEVKWTVIIGIEGMVTIAENTGTYGGTTKPEYEFVEKADGTLDYARPLSCTIGVHKIVQGVPTTSFQTVYFDEYFVKGQDYDGKHVDSMWELKPKTMLKKVALAHAIRATFSACAGLYIAEEVERNVIDGDLVAPDAREQVEKARDFEELQEILGKLSTEEKKRIAPLIAERMQELSK